MVDRLEICPQIDFRVDWNLLPKNQGQHIQEDVLPYALCQLQCPVSAALASIFRMDPISTTYAAPPPHLVPEKPPPLPA